MTVAISFQVRSQSTELLPEQTEELRQEYEKKLEETREVERQRDFISKQEIGALRTLQQLDLDLAASEKALARYQKGIQQNQRKAESLQIELKELHNQDKQYKKLVAKRIGAIYKVGYNGRHAHTLKVLLGAQNIIDLVQKHKYLSFIAEADAALLDQLKAQQEKIRQTRIKLAQQIEARQTASKAAKTKHARILAHKRKREQILHQYQTEKKIYDQTLNELKEAVGKLKDLLGIVDEERIVEKAQEMKGIRKDPLRKLSWPVIGKIVPNQTAFNRGITIQAKKGTPVHGIADGVVARVEAIVGYGNTILIVHGDGYISVYAHLSDVLVKPGEAVREKQVIGRVGETGSLIGEVLYFELWHNYARLNTRQWLTNQP